MATLGELRSRILRLLGDTQGEGYDAALLIDAIGSAFDAILPWMPKKSVHTLTGDGTATAFALPDDFYEAEALTNEYGEVLPRSYLNIGQVIGDRSPASNDWLEYPHGYITLSKAIASSVEYSLYYLARWNKPTNETELTANMEPPEIAIIGISLYGAAYAILPAAVGASEIRQFNMRVDSGQPEHNPMQKTAIYLLDLFRQEMSRHPKHQKVAR